MNLSLSLAVKGHGRRWVKMHSCATSALFYFIFLEKRPRIYVLLFCSTHRCAIAYDSWHRVACGMRDWCCVTDAQSRVLCYAYNRQMRCHAKTQPRHIGEYEPCSWINGVSVRDADVIRDECTNGHCCPIIN